MSRGLPEPAPGARCADIRDLLVPYVDREATPADIRAVEDHVAGCSPCALELERHERLAAALDRRAGRVRAPIPGLAGRVRAADRRSRRARVLALAAAAAVVLAAGWVLMGRALERSDLAAREALIADLDVLEALADGGFEGSGALVDALLEELEESATAGEGDIPAGVLDLLESQELDAEELRDASSG